LSGIITGVKIGLIRGVENDLIYRELTKAEGNLQTGKIYVKLITYINAGRVKRSLTAQTGVNRFGCIEVKRQCK